MKFGKMKAAVLGTMVGVLAGGISTGSMFRKKLNKENELLKKMQRLYSLLNQWLTIRQEGGTLVEYFKKHNLKTVAIYGMKELGERLYDELMDSGVVVKYAIDKNADMIYTEIDIITPDENFEPVDAIIVTAVYYFNEIEEALNKKTDIPIISLEDIIFDY